MRSPKQQKRPSRARGRVTIKDVAESCGVSRATVSNVLTNKPYVSPDTRDLVEKAIEKLGYSQSPIARALRTGRSDTIGVIVSSLANPFYADILLGISQVLTPAGYQTLICNTDSNVDLQSRHIENLLSRSVDGIILVSQTAGSGDVAAIRRAKVPLVTLFWLPKGAPVTFVGMDDDLSMRLPLDHLWNLGHRDIALFCSLTQSTIAEARVRVYRDFMEEKGHPFSNENIIRCPISIEAGRKATKTLLQRAHPPTAIVATGDLWALGATEAIIEAGLSVPADLSVVGFDNTFVASLPQVALTCVGTPRFDLGIHSAQALLRKIAKPDDPIEQILLLPSFEIRSTTAAPREAK